MHRLFLFDSDNSLYNLSHVFLSPFTPHYTIHVLTTAVHSLISFLATVTVSTTMLCNDTCTKLHARTRHARIKKVSQGERSHEFKEVAT